jgi:hypothetical protein
MRKLMLSLDDLGVQTFEVLPKPGRQGTVYGRATDVYTECINNTCDGATCDGAMTACVDCEQQTATCMGGCGGGFSGVESCAQTCPVCTPSRNEACTVGGCTYTCP